MKKRGALSLEMIVAAVIVLFVLVAVIAIFGGQIKESAKTFWNIGEEAKEQAEGERCSSVFGNRACYYSCPAGTDRYDYEEVPEPAGGWNDCMGGKKCCEKVLK